MRLETRQCLADAFRAAQEILDISGEAGENWIEDRTTALAVERLLMVVGEAFVRIRSFEPAVLEKLHDGAKVIGMRNVLVHGYDALDQDRIRDAVRDNLPPLLDELRQLLGD